MIDEVLLKRLVCTLRGDNASAAATTLTTGSHILATGALKRVHYTGADNMPHTAFAFEVQQLGYALQ